MDKETENALNEIKHYLAVHNQSILEIFWFIDQHAGVINFQKENQIQGAQEIGIQIKAIQSDLDKLFDLYHKLESLPNMLSVLEDFKNLPIKKDEKSKTN